MRELERLVFVRGGKGDKDRSTLLAEERREELRAQLRITQVTAAVRNPARPKKLWEEGKDAFQPFIVWSSWTGFYADGDGFSVK
jgi:hypothetical protein